MADDQAVRIMQRAVDFTNAVSAGEFDAAWEWIDPDARLALAQGWVRSASIDTAASRLAEEGPRHHLWGNFAPAQLPRFAIPADFPATLSRVDMLPGPPPVYRVRFARIEDVGPVAAGAIIAVHSVILRGMGEDWRVAGIDDTLLVPGWPPTFEAAGFDDAPFGPPPVMQ